MPNSAVDTFLRQLTLLKRLTHSPASSQELAEYVRHQIGAAAYGDAQQAVRRDIQALNYRYQCEIVYDRKQRKYVVEGLGYFGLISLDDHELETLAQLRELYRVQDNGTLNPAALPLEQRVNRFLEHLVRHLGYYTRQELATIPAGLRAVGGQIPHQPQTEVTLRRLEQYRATEKIEFDYGSLFTVTEHPVRHVVHPFDLIFRDGHFYLVGFMETNDRNPQFCEQWVDYRLDRIIPESIKALGAPIMERPPRPVMIVTYHLHAEVAGRQDFKVALDGKVSIERQSDLSAVVTVHTTMSRFLVRQALLRYGSRCRVLGPPELVRDMRLAAQEMAELYRDDLPQPFA